ncbi:triose-phosphate isomerase [Phaeovibrio sulfidiphilus]|uniref:Triosephosphate isomerase n=1 Tax=Phaeovibrio sulfidiphilus TaxID=1220600 RepID=A0A8J6YL95_9PROT|nr:triose-phosphate isomerase [Phaeovibrio sulfidiphilus]MBE1236643.1 triose-phosphate isomerase [Phaeovibrio sulfidiphilus]
MARPVPLIAGNWKMNGLTASTRSLASELATRVRSDRDLGFEMLICPPFTMLSTAAELVRDCALKLGAQDCHTASSGAHTGDISPAMLRDVGCEYVILGHSERRTDHGETCALVRAKTRAALDAGLKVIVCVGETEAQRDAGETLRVVADQVTGSLPEGVTAETLVVAYEPVWAIGTGRTPTTAEVAEVHAALRQTLGTILGTGAAEGVRLLYGGSVKPDNARELLALDNVNGALVGGASLKVDDFWAIASAV